VPKQQNSVYLYRNGIADFRRVYEVKGGGEKVSIPVKESQVGDVLSSIDYFGNIKLTKPPGYSPKDTQSTLSIESTDPMGSALRAFSGARISLVMKGQNGDITGTLAGCETIEETAANGMTVPTRYVGIYTDEGFRQINLKDEIRSIKFLTDSDKAEFDKALARNYQKIKPGSTFIDLTLTPTTGNTEEAVIQYALPVAAWNMSYRIKRKENGRWSLDGHAVVHNSTDFDWVGYWISVVTGEPTTFEHDLAEAKLPTRMKVNVTADRAQGAVYAEEGVMLESMSVRGAQGPPGGRGARGVAKMAMPSPMSAGMSFAASGGGGGRGFGGGQEDFEADSYNQAEMDMATASNVGDFLILKSPNPADIAANQSALVPMFSKDLDEAERVFYYQPAADPSFPFSAIKFKNTTGMPLTKGVATVTIEGHNAGEAVLEAAKPGDTRLLAHTLETGIKVVRDRAKLDNPISLVRINEGNIYTERRSIASQDYTIKNKLEEDAKILVEHPWNVSQSDVSVVIDGETVSGLEKISTGVRFTFTCKAGATCNIQVKENKIQESTVALDGHQFQWVAQQGYFDKNDQFAKVSTIQEEINRLSQERQELNIKRQALQNDQTRYNGFLPNAGANKDRWETALGKAEDEIVDINTKKIPDYDKKITEASQRMQQALKDLRASWTPGQAKEAA
jgi:hypothetical protein